jgi:hypothetical protein
VVADGAKRELLTDESLERLFGMPVKVAERDGYYHVW